MFKQRYINDISNIAETRKIYKLFLILGDVCNFIIESFIFRKYFWYKTYIKEIDAIDNTSDMINENYSLYLALEEDTTGYLKDYLNKKFKY